MTKWPPKSKNSMQVLKRNECSNVKKTNTKIDMAMCEAQLAALDEKPIFNHHPKRKDYRRDLLEEKENMLKTREKLTAKQSVRIFKEISIKWKIQKILKKKRNKKNKLK